jgi:hypothetical protein
MPGPLYQVSVGGPSSAGRKWAGRTLNLRLRRCDYIREADDDDASAQQGILEAHPEAVGP